MVLNKQFRHFPLYFTLEYIGHVLTRVIAMIIEPEVWNDDDDNERYRGGESIKSEKENMGKKRVVILDFWALSS